MVLDGISIDQKHINYLILFFLLLKLKLKFILNSTKIKKF